MLEIKIDVGYFINIVEALRLIVTECHFKFTSQGMTVQSTDPAQIAYVSVFLEKEGFDEYKCTKALKCGIKLESFGTILKLHRNPADKLTLRIDEVNAGGNAASQVSSEHMEIIIEDTKSQRATEFMMKLIKFEETVPKMPKIKTFRLVTMKSSDFAVICRDLEQISDSVLLKFIEKGISLSVVSDMAEGHINITQNDTMEEPEEDKEEAKSKTKSKKKKQLERETKLMEAVDEGSLSIAHLFEKISIKDETDLKFSLKYLNIFMKGQIFNSVVKIHIPSRKMVDKKEPLMLEFKIGKIGVINYYLSHRIGDDG